MAEIITTGDGKQGGWLHGKRHREGGIPAIVIDTGKSVEVESGEVIITREASQKHWKLLSKINQDGGGVPIEPPQMKNGGNIGNDEIINVKKGKNEINYKNLEDVARRIESGEITIRRLGESEEQGRIIGGRTNVEASLLLAADRRAVGEKFEKKEKHEIATEQEKLLTKYAKKKKLWFNEKEVAAKAIRRLPSGMESHVYLAEDGKHVIKFINYLILSETPAEFLDNRIALHNFLFVETKYELLGFAENNDGFAFVVKQPFILGLELDVKDLTEYGKQKAKLAKYLKDKLDLDNDGSHTYFNSHYVIDDLHLQNVLEDETGALFFIDTAPSLNTKDDDFEGSAEYEDFSLQPVSENNKMLFGGEIDAKDEKLELAKKLKSEGEKDGYILKKTGWFINPFDKMWRYEIDDSEMKFVFDFNRIESKIKEIRQPLITPITKVVKHDKLFSSYPELKQIDLLFVYNEQDNIACIILDRETNKLTIRYNLHEKATLNEITRRLQSGNEKRTEADARKALYCHELQHALQIRHGFASGYERKKGNEETIKREIKKSLSYAGEIESKEVEERLFLNGVSRLSLIPFENFEIRHNVLKEDVIVVKENKINFDKKEKGGKIEPEDEAVISARWDKKKNKIETLSQNIQKLKYNVSTDLKSEDEKEFLTALAVAVMLKTYERVGNASSASNGHYGITGLRKKHIKIEGNKVYLDYVGKSGVEHEKSFTDEKLANALRKALANSTGYLVFSTSSGFRVNAAKINRYLRNFGISAKDLRGFSANKLILEKLNAKDIDEVESKRKKYFLKSLTEVASKIGHGRATLRKHYMIPELETMYIVQGKIIDLSDKDAYETGGAIKSEVLDNGVYNFPNPVYALAKGGNIPAERKEKINKVWEGILNDFKDKKLYSKTLNTPKSENAKQIVEDFKASNYTKYFHVSVIEDNKVLIRALLTLSETYF